MLTILDIKIQLLRLKFKHSMKEKTENSEIETTKIVQEEDSAEEEAEEADTELASEVAEEAQDMKGIEREDLKEITVRKEDQ